MSFSLLFIDKSESSMCPSVDGLWLLYNTSQYVVNKVFVFSIFQAFLGLSMPHYLYCCSIFRSRWLLYNSLQYVVYKAFVFLCFSSVFLIVNAPSYLYWCSITRSNGLSGKKIIATKTQSVSWRTQKVYSCNILKRHWFQNYYSFLFPVGNIYQ